VYTKLAVNATQFSKLHFASCLFNIQLRLPAARTQTKFCKAYLASYSSINKYFLL